MIESDEYRLRIEAYTPATIPMSRLAEYLAELAVMLGESTSVHFVRLEFGSTSIVHSIAKEAIPKIVDRTRSIRRGVGPRDAVRAYKKINRLLREDNGTATWRSEAELISPQLGRPEVFFPGRDEKEEMYVGIRQRGTVEGEVMRVGGTQKVVPIIVRSEQQEIAGCWADRAVAKALAKQLFEPVRLFGMGRWNRNDEGLWKLDIFKVESFQPLKSTSLSAALTKLRTIALPWAAESYNELDLVRNGPGEANGGL